MHAPLELRLCDSRAAVVKEAIVEDGASINILNALLVKIDIERRMAVIISVFLRTVVSYCPFLFLRRALGPVFLVL